MSEMGEWDDAAARPLPAHLHPRGRAAGAGGRSRGRRWVVAVRALAAVLSVTILGGTGYAWASYQHFTSGLTKVDGIPAKKPGSPDRDGPAQNILLVGDDHRPANASKAELALLSTGQDGGSTNTDTMMILHLPAGGGAPTVISLPRDSWVAIPGHGKGKLNSAFALGAAQGGGDAGGMRLLIQSIQNLTGLTIDHFVRVSLLGFYDIADVLGPIQVCLNQAAHDAYSGTDLPAGVSTLNAKQALSFVRQRHGLDQWGGDLAREVRQQYFLSVELHKVLSAGTLLNPVKTQNLLSAVSSSIETDSGMDLLSMSGRFANLTADKITYVPIPITGTPTITDASGNRVSIVAVNTTAMPAFIDGILGTSQTSTGGTATPTSPATSPVDPAAVSVRVLNATGRGGLAATTTADLRHLGFATATPANAATQRTTTITYPAGELAAAQALALHVPGATLAAGGTGQTLTLTLGTDGSQVAPVGGSPSSAAAPAASTDAAHSFTTTSCIN